MVIYGCKSGYQSGFLHSRRGGCLPYSFSVPFASYIYQLYIRPAALIKCRVYKITKAVKSSEAVRLCGSRTGMGWVLPGTSAMRLSGKTISAFPSCAMTKSRRWPTLASAPCKRHCGVFLSSPSCPAKSTVPSYMADTRKKQILGRCLIYKHLHRSITHPKQLINRYMQHKKPCALTLASSAYTSVTLSCPFRPLIRRSKFVAIISARFFASSATGPSK